MLKFSIVLCTLNRPEILETCVKSLKAQLYKNFEIIIIDQSDNKNHRYINQEPLFIYRHIMEKGLSNARNEAIKLASGDYICLMDDDAEYDNDFLLKAQDSLIQNPVGIIIGKVIDKLTGRPGAKGMSVDKIISVNEGNAFRYCMSPGMVIRTKTVKEIGFDNELGVGKRWGAGEETDLALRFLYKGEKVMYNPRMLVYHPSLERDDIPVPKVFSYNLGFGALYKKHISKYGKKKMYMEFSWWILRNVIGCILFRIIGNESAAAYYDNSVKGKLLGFKEYK